MIFFGYSPWHHWLYFGIISKKVKTFINESKNLRLYKSKVTSHCIMQNAVAVEEINKANGKRNGFSAHCVVNCQSMGQNCSTVSLLQLQMRFLTAVKNISFLFEELVFVIIWFKFNDSLKLLEMFFTRVNWKTMLSLNRYYGFPKLRLVQYLRCWVRMVLISCKK